jgi:hypothetical protein
MSPIQLSLKVDLSSRVTNTSILRKMTRNELAALKKRSSFHSISKNNTLCPGRWQANAAQRDIYNGYAEEEYQGDYTLDLMERYALSYTSKNDVGS